MSAGTEFLAKLQAAKANPKPEGVYEVSGGWTHRRSDIVYDDKSAAEIDCRFTMEWLAAEKAWLRRG